VAEPSLLNESSHGRESVTSKGPEGVPAAYLARRATDELNRTKAKEDPGWLKRRLMRQKPGQQAVALESSAMKIKSKPSTEEKERNKLRKFQRQGLRRPPLRDPRLTLSVDDVNGPIPVFSPQPPEQKFLKDGRRYYAQSYNREL
jgi:hypothetical protein